MPSLPNIFDLKRNSSVFNPKCNSIGFLRLILALAVIYAHASPLGGFHYDLISYVSSNSYSTGEIAVDGFFALSGYLITASYLRLKSLPRFLWHRILRLFPAYWVCLVIVGLIFTTMLGGVPDLGYISHNLLSPARSGCLVIVGIVFPLSLGWAADFGHFQQKYWLAGQSSIPPLLSNNPFPDAINGSLWTLDPEFRCYIIIGLLGLIGLLSRNFLSGLLLLVWVGYILFYQKHLDPNITSALRFPSHFLAGAAFYFWRPRLNQILVFLAFTLAAVALMGGVYPLVSPLTTPYLLLWLAAVLPFQNVGRTRDYSYGLYIYAFPVQQTLSAYGFNQWGFPFYLLLSVAFTFPLAAASWHMIEKPALKWKDTFSRKPN